MNKVEAVALLGEYSRYPESSYPEVVFSGVGLPESDTWLAIVTALGRLFNPSVHYSLIYEMGIMVPAPRDCCDVKIR